MKGFIAVTFGPSAPERLRRPVSAAVGCLVDAAVAVTHEAADDGWVAFSGDQQAASDSARAAGGFAVSLGKVLRAVDGDRTARAVAPLVVSAGRSLAELLPPFAIVHRRDATAPILVANDWLGFFQLFVWHGPGIAAISTSARALAVLAGGNFSELGLGVQALMGAQLDDATIFDGVRVMPPASVATLQHGTLSLRAYADPLAFAPSSAAAPTLTDAVEEMAAILKARLTSYVTEHPDTLLQLTGGNDSRMLLAAIAPAQRRGLRALTLGDQGSRDVAIASDLCRRYGMIHQVHRVDEQEWPSPAGVHELVMSSARQLECLASPIALAPVLLAESAIQQGHRLAGLGGEVARGFYYGAQPRHASTSPSLIGRLAHWRLWVNEAVEPAALDVRFLDAARSETMKLLNRLFPAGDWLRATDEFYLYQRVRRWGGAHGTVGAMHRESVNLMLDRRFIELALAVGPEHKRGSKLFGLLMSTLDRELADIPLDSGLVLSRLGQASLLTKVVVATWFGRRTTRKVWQRFVGGRRPQVGAAAAAHRLLQHWRATPDVCAPLLELPFLRADWVRAVLAATQDPKPTTLAFLANMLTAATLERPSSTN